LEKEHPNDHYKIARNKKGKDESHRAAVGIKGVNWKAYEMCKTCHRILLVLRVDQVKCWF
jgi:hypothetical protein